MENFVLLLLLLLYLVDSPVLFYHLFRFRSGGHRCTSWWVLSIFFLSSCLAIDICLNFGRGKDQAVKMRSFSGRWPIDIEQREPGKTKKKFDGVG